MADNTAWHAVHPTGLAAVLLGVTISFTSLCLIVIGLRVYLRVSTNLFSTEDYLMCAGVTLNMVHNAIVMYGSYTGVGSYDSKLNMAIMMEGAKIVFLWQLFYVSGSLLIKSSICATLMRIATQRVYKYILGGLITIATIATFTACLTVLIRCKPVSASWTGDGKCLDQSIIVTLTYVVSAVNIVTDWSVAIIPMFVLWNVQMRKNLKILTSMILGLGVLASTATIIRMPYSSAYTAKHDSLHDIGNIIVWTVVECGIGIIAGSLPMLRKLFKQLAKDYSTGPQSIGTDLVTFGRLPKSKGQEAYDAELNVTVQGGEREDDSNSDGVLEQDGESMRRIIHVTRKWEQTDDVGPQGYLHKQMD